MDLIAKIRSKAAATKRVIVLPEGTEPRTVIAANEVVQSAYLGGLYGDIQAG